MVPSFRISHPLNGFQSSKCAIGYVRTRCRELGLATSRKTDSFFLEEEERNIKDLLGKPRASAHQIVGWTKLARASENNLH